MTNLAIPPLTPATDNVEHLGQEITLLAGQINVATHRLQSLPQIDSAFAQGGTQLLENARHGAGGAAAGAAAGGSIGGAAGRGRRDPGRPRGM